MRAPLIVIAAAALIGGCSSRPSTDDAANTVQPTVVNAMPDLTANAMAAAGGEPSPTASPAALPAIPAEFQGRWGLVANDCDRAKADVAKGLMSIAGSRVAFYESRGEATHIRRLSPTKIAFDLPMSGEGQSWSEPTTLTLLGGGRSLIRDATGSRDRTGSYPYQRCPA